MSFSRDSLPASSAPRSSYDFSQMDNHTLLDADLSRPLVGAGSTPDGKRARFAGAAHAARTVQSMPRRLQRKHSSERKDADDGGDEADNEGGGNSAPPLSRPHYSPAHIPMAFPVDPVLRRGVTTSSLQMEAHSHSTAAGEYRSLGQGLHFDDVLREKTAAPSEPPPPAAAAWRITVTGELTDQSPSGSDSATARRAAARKATDGVRARRNNAFDEDSAEGCVKSFTDLDAFLLDEERRRSKYDVAAQAHAVCMENAAAAATAAAAAAAVPALGDLTATSSDSAARREPPSTPSPSPPSLAGDISLTPAHGSEPLPQTPLWISVEDADDETTELIGRYFGLHPLTIEDCQSKGIREKLEVFPEYLFLVFHALEEANGMRHMPPPHSSHRHLPHEQIDTAEVMKATPLKLVVFPSLVLSFHKGGLGSVATVRRQLEKLYRNRVLNTAWLIHGLLDVVSDSLMPVVDMVAKSADDMEDLIYIINPGRERHKDVLKRMGFIARRLTFLRQRLWSKRDILTSLIEKDWQSFLVGVKVPYLRDIYDHLVIMLHKLDSAIEVIVTLQSTYLAVVSIDVAAVANEGNAAMKTLSAGATILLPLSLIASIMGMNVMVPFDAAGSDIDWRDLLPFTSICFAMVLVSFYMYRYFKKKQYL